MTILDFTERKNTAQTLQNPENTPGKGRPPAHPFLHNTVKMRFMTLKSRIMSGLH